MSWSTPVCGGAEGKGEGKKTPESRAWLPLPKFQSLPTAHRLTGGAVGLNPPQPA